MDFTFTEAQDDLSGLARPLLADRSTTHIPDGTGFDRPLWDTLIRAGLIEATLPAPIGNGFGLLEQCTVLMELGRVAASVPYLTTVAVAAATIAAFGDDAQLRRWVEPITAGQFTLAVALSTDDDRVTATRSATGWQFEGRYSAIPAAAFADAVLLEAHTSEGPLLAVLDRDTAGLRITAQQVVDGADAALLELDAVRVDSTNVLGSPGNGAAAWAQRHATVAVCAYQLGVVERALESTAEYALTRQQFGKPIGSFQAVRQRLADAHLDVEAVRLTLWQAAWRESQGLPADAEIATAKFWAAEAGHRVAHTMVHVHASIGIFLDYPVHRYFLAAKRTEFLFGSATEQLRTLATALTSARSA
ncbi:acyl-CoA dehydrogenase family protein [Nocardia sp. NPDC046763]|uniref:acyl-CoA dehydrogenase family protein n=1 Tax=Nocardia sp. NPDC046763 TaxID=3155256 RepID=UPI0033BFC446